MMCVGANSSLPISWIDFSSMKPVFVLLLISVVRVEQGEKLFSKQCICILNSNRNTSHFSKCDKGSWWSKILEWRTVCFCFCMWEVSWSCTSGSSCVICTLEISTDGPRPVGYLITPKNTKSNAINWKVDYVINHIFINYTSLMLLMILWCYWLIMNDINH